MSKLTPNQIIIALDNFDEDDLYNYLDSIENNNLPSTLKIGLELFCKHGPNIIKKIYEKYNTNIFLDLKLHDIPNTVAKSIKSLRGLPVSFLTLHLSGGEKMLQSAKQAQEEFLPDTKLLGVSYLTSLSHQDILDQCLQSKEMIPELFDALFNLAIENNIQGVVLSPHELEHLSKLDIQNKLLKVTPGIRLSHELTKGTQDQTRVMTPEQAIALGANHLVMGRSLTTAKNPNQVLSKLFS